MRGTSAHPPPWAIPPRIASRCNPIASSASQPASRSLLQMMLPATHLLVDCARKRQEHRVALAEIGHFQIIKTRNAAATHPARRHRVGIVTETDGLADAVRAAEDPVVHVLRDHHDRGAILVLRRAPGPAEFERHIEHRKEIRIGGAREALGRLLLRIRRLQRQTAPHTWRFGACRVAPSSMPSHRCNSAASAKPIDGSGPVC